jgi:hypothetical protein
MMDQRLLLLWPTRGGEVHDDTSTDRHLLWRQCAMIAGDDVALERTLIAGGASNKNIGWQIDSQHLIG